MPIYDAHLYQNFKELLLQKGFVFVGEGCFRTAYRRGNVVVKVPRSDDGFEDNILEAYAYHRYRKNSGYGGYVFAPCRLLSNACLMMVYVNRVFSYDESIPIWCRWIDGTQCGWYKNRIVAYDSGADILALREVAFKWAGLL